MAKQKKKRNKPYRGQDAGTPSEPVVRRYTAVDRGRVGQWWFEKKRFVKIVATISAVVIVVIWLIVVLVQTIAA